jgi:sporulation protein YlmC with PRC-barrel domain
MTAVQTVSADKIAHTRVINPKNESLGHIEDVMINLDNGNIAYFVLSFGGLLGTSLGDKRFAIPFKAFRVSNDNDEVVFVLNVDKEYLRNAPGFDKGDYPDFADPAFESEHHQYYAAYAPPR